MAQQGPEMHPDTNTDPPNWIPAPGDPYGNPSGHISLKTGPLFGKIWPNPDFSPEGDLDT